MGIDGIGGPKGPSGATQADNAGAVTSADEPTTPFTVNDTTGAQKATGPTVEPAVAEAIDTVASDVKSGRIANEQAFGAVVERIVERRYTNIPASKRHRMAEQMTEVLRDDPGVGAAIASLLAERLG